MRAALRPICRRPEAALDFLMQATNKAGYEPGKQVMFALDCAATEFFKDGKYVYQGEGKTRSREEHGRYLAELAGHYPIVVDRGRHGRRRHRRLENTDQGAGRRTASSSATICS